MNSTLLQPQPQGWELKVNQLSQEQLPQFNDTQQMLKEEPISQRAIEPDPVRNRVFSAKNSIGRKGSGRLGSFARISSVKNSFSVKPQALQKQSTQQSFNEL